jgi:hypothetical protein
MFQIETYQEKTEEQLTIRHFENAWRNLMNKSFLNNQQVVLFIHPQSIEYGLGKSQKTILLPKTMHAITTDSLVDKNGHVKPRTITFISKKFGETYEYAIQLQWGVLHEKFS